MLRFWGFFQVDEGVAPGAQPIDMGNGRFIQAEDLLEGHFHRLSADADDRVTQGDLSAAITGLAPTLAPLTEVATEVAQVMPQVQPTAHFRQELHKALELTHRQHSAQRILGTRPETPEPVAPWSTITALLFAAALLLGALFYLQRRNRENPQPI